MAYDPDVIRGYFDRYGEREWERLGRRADDAVSLHVHSHYLRRFLEPGMHVLDAGAGPGRFTIEAARLGARVTALDLSERMLEQHRRHVAAAGLEAAVVERVLGDITDLGRFDDASFDAVVCYGGPLSYVMERADDALDELLRVSRRGAPLLLSVMSTFGSLRAYLRPILDTAAHTVAGVLETGLLTQAFQSNDHVLKMYRWEELEALLSRHACTLDLATACSFLTTGRPESVAELAPDDATWRSILDWELRCCRERGALDAGTHTLVVVRKEG